MDMAPAMAAPGNYDGGFKENVWKKSGSEECETLHAYPDLQGNERIAVADPGPQAHVI